MAPHCVRDWITQPYLIITESNDRRHQSEGQITQYMLDLVLHAGKKTFQEDP